MRIRKNAKTSLLSLSLSSMPPPSPPVPPSPIPHEQHQQVLTLHEGNKSVVPHQVGRDDHVSNTYSRRRKGKMKAERDEENIDDDDKHLQLKKCKHNVDENVCTDLGVALITTTSNKNANNEKLLTYHEKKLALDEEIRRDRVRRGLPTTETKVVSRFHSENNLIPEVKAHVLELIEINYKSADISLGPSPPAPSPVKIEDTIKVKMERSVGQQSPPAPERQWSSPKAVKSCEPPGLRVDPTEEELVKIEDNIEEKIEDKVEENCVGRKSATSDPQWSSQMTVKSCARQGLSVHPTEEEPVKIEDNVKGNKENNVGRESASPDRRWSSPTVVESCAPPGFRFHPTEEELVGYYLKRKINSESIDFDVIPDIDLYRMEPWDLKDRCKLGYEEWNEWHFFNLKGKKYQSSTRTNRATAAGYWKTTCRDKPVVSKEKIIGMRTTLAFYKGRAPNGIKSDWYVHEYRLQTSENAPPQGDGWVLCRAFKKPTQSHRQAVQAWNHSYNVSDQHHAQLGTIANGTVSPLHHLAEGRLSPSDNHQVEIDDNLSGNRVERESAIAFERWWGSPVEVKSCVPPGFRFLPTEEELVGYYLYRKINSEGIDLDVITDVDLYRIEPWDLQDICKVGNQERNEWYFFSHNDKKYLTGKCTNRATAAGFWKTTGRDKPVLSKQKIIGMKRILVFYKGRAPRGNKSDWIMHEYRLQTSENAPPQDEGWVVCRAFKKPTRSHSETAEACNQSQGLRHLGHQVEMNDNVTENGFGRESASAFMSIASAKKKLEEVRKEDKERNISMLSEANEKNEERKHSVLCKKSDEKGWKCKREAKEGHSLCEHHLNLIRSYYPYLKCEIPKVGGCLPLAEEVRVSSSARDC